jgi:hypothetical protein
MKAAMTRTGPNDAKRVVWAISEFFLLKFRVFSILNYNYGYTRCFTGTERINEDGDDENGPKRRETRRLGH